MYRYETHLHTAPVSKCAKGSVRDNLLTYKELGYDGVFITNHFLDGHIGIDKTLPFEEKMKFYVSDYEEGKRIGEEIGLKVFFGVESTHQRADILIYGLDPQWYFDHPEFMEMEKYDLLPYLREEGALLIHAHPFRFWTNRPMRPMLLYPFGVDGVEIYNACRNEKENGFAALYAKEFELLPFAGSDTHNGPNQKRFTGLESETPVLNEKDFCEKVRSGALSIFKLEREIPTSL